MTNATKRTILRWFHLVCTIPVLGYVYGNPADVQQYVGGPRYIFVPALILSGYWMYAGALFAIIAVAASLAAFQLGGFGAAILSQLILLLGRRIWIVMRARRVRKVPA